MGFKKITTISRTIAAVAKVVAEPNSWLAFQATANPIIHPIQVGALNAKIPFPNDFLKIGSVLRAKPIPVPT
jgi:hypothetical protein